MDARFVGIFWVNFNPISGQYEGLLRGFELDLVIRSDYFESCVSENSFDSGYDDCPTAGVSEDTNQWSFGCGTYQGIQFSIPQGSSQKHRHLCEFTFQQSPDVALSTDVGINAQISTHQICPADSIWCMDSEATERLNDSSHGSSKYYINYGNSYNDVWGGWPYSNGVLTAPAINTLIMND